MRFDLIVENKSGKENRVANALSQLNINPNPNEIMGIKEGSHIHAQAINTIQAAWMEELCKHCLEDSMI